MCSNRNSFSAERKFFQGKIIFSGDKKRLARKRKCSSNIYKQLFILDGSKGTEIWDHNITKAHYAPLLKLKRKFKVSISKAIDLVFVLRMVN
jgi:hypothetical protein